MSDILTADFILTSAQIKALGGYTILAAPGSGYLYLVTNCLMSLLAGSDAVADPLIADASMFLSAGANTILAVFLSTDLGSTASKQKSTAVSMPLDTLAHLDNQALKLSYAGTAITGNAAADARLFCSITYRSVPV